MDGEQRAEVDEFLAGPRRRRGRDAAELIGLGGDVVAGGGGT